MVLSAARHAGEARLDDLHANERNRGDGEIRSVGSWHSQPTTIKPVTDGDSRRSVRYTLRREDDSLGKSVPVRAGDGHPVVKVLTVLANAWTLAFCVAEPTSGQRRLTGLRWEAARSGRRAARLSPAGASPRQQHAFNPCEAGSSADRGAARGERPPASTCRRVSRRSRFG